MSAPVAPVAPSDRRSAPVSARTRRIALLLALPALGFVGGLAVRRVSSALLGPALATIVLALVLVALVRRRRARKRREEAPEGRATRPGAVPASERRQDLRPLLFFHYGYLPAYLVGDLGVGAVALVLLGLLAAVLLLVVAVRASRRRRWARARAAHPGAAVVVGTLVDLASMRLMQWFRAAEVARPFVANGRVVLAADADGVVLDQVGRSSGPVHRWAWSDVEVSSRPHPDGALLVLTLLGLAPAVRGRVVPVVRRRLEITVALRIATLAATVLPTTLAAADGAAAALLARRPASAAGPAGAPAGPTGGTTEAPAR